MTNILEKPIDIHVEHIARVEGHGNIKIGIEDGKLTECTWEVVETPRFFEMMFKGLSIEMAPLLAARVCGICSISHALTAARAAERALNIQVPETAQKIRLLAKHAETLQSHVLHLFFLVAPDFLNVGSVIPILSSHPHIVQIATQLKGYANRASDLLAGRTSHPMVFKVGGLTQVPRKRQLKNLLNELEENIPYLEQAIEIFKGLSMPDFERETEFVSLKGQDRYPFIGGDLVSSDGIRMGEDEYQAMTNEYMVDISTSKWCKLSRDSFAVGALARFNNNYELLHPKAIELAEEIGLKPGSHNPFFHNLAQLVECVHVVYESKDMLTELIDSDTSAFMASYEVHAGEGVGALEAPRGILYHHFQIDDEGKIVKANCVIPTGQNHANIHHDLHKLVPELAAQGEIEAEISKRAQMLVRAYDPCISCSVH
ncbi:MAG: Ni/Fe hydrogenase subunit alpha [Anaerolineales bacterium]|nr:Ni/Fe hydrogenase subunit alpha [Chloroflexota bacterium]MBL6982213.1 Ni/Fe hydrogenase subunit alpha [Anaerolineales bacterium]